MDEEMNLGEILKKEIEKRVLYMVLLMINESSSLDELKKKVEALLNQ